MLDLRFRNWS